MAAIRNIPAPAGAVYVPPLVMVPPPAPSRTTQVTGWLPVNVTDWPRDTVTGEGGTIVMGGGPSGGCGAEMDEAVTLLLVPTLLIAVSRYVYTLFAVVVPSLT